MMTPMQMQAPVNNAPAGGKVSRKGGPPPGIPSEQKSTNGGNNGQQNAQGNPGAMLPNYAAGQPTNPQFPPGMGAGYPAAPQQFAYPGYPYYGYAGQQYGGQYNQSFRGNPP